MRRKHNQEMKDWIESIAKDKTSKELVQLVNEKYNETYNVKTLVKYLWRNKIQYKRNKNKVHQYGVSCEIGSERIKTDGGFILVKTSENKWEYKHKLLYEQHYNTKLKEDEFIIFLNGDRTDCRIENLKKVSRRNASIYATFNRNYGIKFNDEEMTNIQLDIVDLIVATKRREKQDERLQQETL